MKKSTRDDKTVERLKLEYIKRSPKCEELLEREARKGKNRSAGNAVTVFNYRESVFSFVNEAHALAKERSRSPGIKALKEEMKYLIWYPGGITDIYGNIFLRVKISPHSPSPQQVDMLTNEVRKVIKKQIPQRHLNTETLKKDLEIYDLWVQHKGIEKDIVAAASMTKPPRAKAESIRTDLSRARRRAKRRIEKIEANDPLWWLVK